MPAQPQTSTESPLANLAEGIIRDTERLIGQHFELMRHEVKEEVNQARAAAVSLSAGAGLVAVGGILTTFMLVHLLHRATRVPLWGCYGIVGGTLTGLGAGMLYKGAREVAEVQLLPPQTSQALQDDVSWVKEQALPARS